MSKLKVDEFYSASPAPGEDIAQEGEITVVISRDELALLEEMRDSRNLETTRVKDKTGVATFPATSPYTPAKSSEGEDVTNEEVESLINHSRNALSSDYKNTNLGDTRLKRSSENADEPRDVEDSLVDSTAKGHQDGDKDKQDSPVSVKDTPGEAAHFNWVMGPGNASSAQQGSQTQQTDLPYDVSGATSSIFVEGASMEELKKIADKVKDKGITVALKAGKSLRPKIVANGTKYAMSVRLICGEQLSERECLELTSILVAMSTKLCKGDKVVIERLQTTTDFRHAPPNVVKLFESILSIAQRELGCGGMESRY